MAGLEPTAGSLGRRGPPRGCAGKGASTSIRSAQPRSLGLLPHACHWHDGCTARFASKRQLFNHLEEVHGLRRATGKWVSSGNGARARRREARWQFDDYGMPVIQKVFNASAPTPSAQLGRTFSGRVRRAPKLGIRGSDEYLPRRDVQGRWHWEPPVEGGADAEPPQAPRFNASSSSAATGSATWASRLQPHLNRADDFVWGAGPRALGDADHVHL